MLALEAVHEESKLLVSIVHFDRFLILVLLKNKTAQTVVTTLIDEDLCKFNTPKVLISDRGTEFNNSILIEICKQFYIRKTNKTAYHATSDGQIEHQNRKKNP